MMKSLKEKNKTRAGDIKKILVVKLSHLGDLVMATAVLGRIKAAFPGADITLLVKAMYLPLLKGQKDIGRTIGFNAPWSTHRLNWLNIYQLLKSFIALKHENYDLALCLDDDKKSNVFVCLLGIKLRLGFDFKGSGRFLTHAFSSDYTKGHRIDRMAALIEAAEVWLGRPGQVQKAAGDLKPGISINKEEQDRACQILKQNGFRPGCLFAIHAWSGAANKRCAPDLYKKILLSLLSRIEGSKALLIIGPNDQITEQLYVTDYAARIFKVKAGLPQMAAFISACSLYIGNDSGVSHLAAALNIPTICLFAASDPDLWKPTGREVHVIKSNLSCSPCFFPGDPFFCQDMRCLGSFDGHALADLAVSILEKQNPSNIFV